MTQVVSVLQMLFVLFVTSALATPQITPSPATLDPGSSASTAECPSGYTPDYRHFCRPTKTTASGAAKMTCPSGSTPDYRGYSYCRPVLPPWTPPADPATSCSEGYSTYHGYCVPIMDATTYIPTGWTTKTVVSPTPQCASGSTTNYRGLCVAATAATATTPHSAACQPGWTTDYRGVCTAAATEWPKP